jgi:hypothetical protein
MAPVPPKAQPALYAGIAIGVLSALPVINLGNCVCCMWVVGGGALAVYLMQQNHPYAVTSADGALVGLMAGAIGGIVSVLLSIPLMMAMGPMQQRIIERIADNPDIPEQTRVMIQRMGMNAAMGGALAARVLFGLIGACIDAVFGLLGGLLGVALFKKKDLPPPGTTEILPPA